MLAQLGPIRIAITRELQEKCAVMAPMCHVKHSAFSPQSIGPRHGPQPSRLDALLTTKQPAPKSIVRAKFVASPSSIPTYFGDTRIHQNPQPAISAENRQTRQAVELKAVNNRLRETAQALENQMEGQRLEILSATSRAVV
jgi:hypothetical protein